MDQRSIFIFHNYEINEGKIKQRKNYVYRDWKSGKIAIGFSYVSFTRTISLSLSLFLSFSLFTLLFNFLFHSSFFLLFFQLFFSLHLSPLLRTPLFVPRYFCLPLSISPLVTRFGLIITKMLVQ